MADDLGLSKRVRLQNRETMRDLPARCILISLGAILAAAFMPLAHVVIFAIGWVAFEIAGVAAISRFDRRADRGGIVLLLAHAFACAAWVAGMLVLLWSQNGFSPKIVAFTGLATALLHTTMVRTTWMAYGLVTAVPLVAGLLYCVASYLFLNERPADAVAGTVFAVAMVGYMLRTMVAMNRTQREIVAARDREAEISRAKSRFLATMSHEIRTPLNAIYGISQLLRDDPDSGLVAERTSLLLKASAALRSIVDDVLDHARIEAGRHALRPRPASLDSVVQTVADFHRTLAQEQGLELTIEVAPEVPARALFDPLRVGQVLGNLVSNAVKYSEDGRVTLRLSSAPEPGGWRVAISVSDQGQGLTEDEVARLFNDFERIERDDGRDIAGTGLGLSIALGFARMMDGGIDVESQPGQGATFTFRFHAGLADESAESRRPEREAATVSKDAAILLVDDNASNRYVARAFLKDTGLSIVEARNGAEAMEELRQRPFALILLDMHMPVMNGPAMLAAMRKAGGRIAATPVIALSADATEDQRARYLELGLEAYIAKPVKRRDLLTQVARVLDQAGADARPAMAGSPAKPRR